YYSPARRSSNLSSLKYLGFQLEEIKNFLENPDYQLEDVLYRQMKQVRTEIELGKKLYKRLETITNHLNSAENPSVDELLKTLNTMTKYEKYNSKDKQEYLEQRKQAAGEQRTEEVQQERKELIAEVRQEMEKGGDLRSEN